MIWVGPTPAKAYEPADLAFEGGLVALKATTPVALRSAEGPFEPLVQALERQPALRDELLRGIQIPSLRNYRRLRLAGLILAAPSALLLLELDRELVTHGHASLGRVAVNVLTTAFAAFELTRRSPRMPAIAAAALITIAMRWGIIITRTCGKSHLAIWIAAALPLIVAGAILVLVPSRARVIRELLGKLGISRSEEFAFGESTTVSPRPHIIAAAVSCAAAMPLFVHIGRALGLGMVGQGLVLVALALIAPRLIEKPPKLTVNLPRMLNGILVGLVLTASIVTAARLFFDAGAELAQCLGKLGREAQAARAAEASELGRAVNKVRLSTILIAATSIAFPFAEERIFRGVLQDVLVRKYGRAYGIFAASLGFGLAHLGVYQVALYQTVLVGIGFGIAFAEGGLLAAILVHATWNLLQLV